MTGYTLDVPAAKLYYEVRGSGPPLLLIPGGWGDSGQFNGLVPLLATAYTVVTYDPRGLSRSTRADAAADITVGVQADDASRLLAAVASERALVLGVSGGALTGLELVSRHGHQVRILLAHEPPIVDLMPHHEQVRAWVRQVCDTHERKGAFEAMHAFLAGADLDGEQDSGDAEPPGPEMLDLFGQTLEQMTANLDLFFGQMFGPIADYRPDPDALRATSSLVIAAAGKASAGQLSHRGAVALAELLDTHVVEFPGDHGAFMDRPTEFATALRRVLQRAVVSNVAR